MVNSRRQIDTLAFLILGAAFFTAFYGLWHFQSHLIWGWKNPYYRGRLCGTFINSNHAAGYLGMAVFLGFGLFLAQKKNGRPPPGGRRGLTTLRLRDFWEYRELLFFLTWRDIKIRYKQTLLGVAWAVLQPFFTMVVFSIFFGKLARVPSDNIPYPLFSFAALVPWTFFAYSLNQSANSLVGNANLIQKVYFPRLIIPVSSVLSGVVDFFLAFVVLLGMMLFYGFRPGPKLIWLGPLLLLILVTALGPGLWLAALNVEYRDVRYTLPFLTQFWLFATPIAYPSSLLPEPWRTLYGLNPMAGVVEGCRWVLLDTPTTPGPMIAASALASLAVLAGGAFYFRRMEKTFADLI